MAVLLKRSEVVKKTALSASQIYRLMHAGEFPKAVQLSERSVAWVEHEVDAWIESRIEASRSAAA